MTQAIPEIDVANASRDEMLGFIMSLRQLVNERVEVPIETLRLAVEVSRRLSVTKTRPPESKTKLVKDVRVSGKGLSFSLKDII